MPQILKVCSYSLVCSAARTSLFQSIVAVTLLSELQKGQENDTSSFGLCFLGGGFEDFLLPMGLTECNVTQSPSHKCQEGSVAPTVLQCCKCNGYLSGLHEGILVHDATAGKLP